MRPTASKVALALLSSSALVKAQDDFYYGEYGAMAFDRFFDTETMSYMYIETYDPNYTYWYIYDSEGGTCYGETVFASDGSI